MNKLANFISNLREDHKAHFIVGVLTGFPMVLLFGNIGGLIAIIIYALKELVYDKALDWLYSSIPVFFYLIIKNF